MALTQTERSYETLIRHNADGTTGAHHIKITEIWDGKTLLTAQLGTPMSLATVEGADGQAVAEVLGAELTEALKTVTMLQAEGLRKDKLIASLQAAVEAFHQPDNEGV